MSLPSPLYGHYFVANRLSCRNVHSCTHRRKKHNNASNRWRPISWSVQMRSISCC